MSVINRTALPRIVAKKPPMAAYRAGPARQP